MIEYHAPGGVAYEPIVTDNPASFLERAKESAAAKIFTSEDFEPDDNAVRIHEIKIVNEDGTLPLTGPIQIFSPTNTATKFSTTWNPSSRPQIA
jgi:hypothetical protein